MEAVWIAVALSVAALAWMYRRERLIEELSACLDEAMEHVGRLEDDLDYSSATLNASVRENMRLRAMLRERA